MERKRRRQDCRISQQSSTESTHDDEEDASVIMVRQLKPLNVITLGKTKSDKINRMLTVTSDY